MRKKEIEMLHLKYVSQVSNNMAKNERRNKTMNIFLKFFKI